MDGGWSVFIGLAGLVVNAVGLAFIAIQVSLARRQLAAAQQTQVEELDRRRKEATTEAFHETAETRGRLRGVLPDEWDSKATRAYVERVLAGDSELEAPLRDYLGHLENFAVAVSAGIYDLEVTDSLFGARLIQLSTVYKAYIDARRQKAGHDGYYAELEWLCQELARKSYSGPPYVPLARRPRRT